MRVPRRDATARNPAGTPPRDETPGEAGLPVRPREIRRAINYDTGTGAVRCTAFRRKGLVRTHAELRQIPAVAGTTIEDPAEIGTVLSNDHPFGSLQCHFDIRLTTESDKEFP